MADDDLTDLAARVLDALRARDWRLATAESCTGGLIAATLTEIAGSSDVVDRGFVTYSNAAKIDMLGVSAALIEEHGAVSEPVAVAMAEGAISSSAADIAISVTGIAGPGGATAKKPVGLVFFGWALRHDDSVWSGALRYVYAGDRRSIRLQSVRNALEILTDIASPAIIG